jgi:DNA-binding XRE family transcriptional regulator
MVILENRKSVFKGVFNLYPAFARAGFCPGGDTRPRRWAGYGLVTKRQRTLYHALPFCHLQIKALRCPYPRLWKCTQAASIEPKTLGEHIKKRRLEIHLIQSQLAKRLGVHRVSVQNWERNIYQPTTELMPQIIEFLGYDPQL